MINGIINVYKEKGYTSHDVVAKMRGILKIKKIGHTGTLDPEAEGVLPVCIGKATKVVDLILEKDKTYEAVLKLGFVTDTQDMTGKVIRSSSVNVTLDRIIEVARGFIGGYNQLPPMYSAVKVNGRKLYELARQGKEIERSSRWVEIHNILILGFDSEENEVSLRVDCGKGTYIRTLLYDMGELLGCGGTMKSLIRSRVGGFNLDKALRLSQIEELVSKGLITDYVTRIDDLFLSYPKVIVKEEYNRLINNGNAFKVEHLDNEKEFFDKYAYIEEKDSSKDDYTCKYGYASIDDLNSKDTVPYNRYLSVRVYDSKGDFIAIYRYDRIDKIFQVEKMFI